jgi:hypothetical protein
MPALESCGEGTEDSKLDIVDKGFVLWSRCGFYDPAASYVENDDRASTQDECFPCKLAVEARPV